MTKAPASPLVARTFRMQTNPALARAMAALFILTAIGFAVALTLLPLPHWHRGWVQVLACMMAAAFVLFNDSAMAGARLTVDDRGIRLENRSKGGWAARYPRPWSVEWKDIDQVVANPGLGIVQLKYKRRVTPLRILVRQWIPEDVRAPKPKLLLLKRPDVTQSELWRALEARGLFDPDRFGGARDASNFDMAKHPATRWALIAGVVVLAYGIADLGMNPKSQFLVPSIVIAAFVAGATFMLVYRSRRPYAVPVAVTAVVTLFMAGATLVASWAALSHWA